VIRPLAVLAVALSVATADAQESSKVLYDRGVAAFQAHDYAGAVSALRAAYEAEPRPEILFAWAQAERLAGDCAHAIVLYRKFLDGHPPAIQAEAAQGPLERCERALASAVAPPAPPVPETRPAPPAAVVTEAAPEPEPAPAVPPPHRRFYQDAVGDVLVGAGLAAVGVGVALLVTAGSPDGAMTWDDFQTRHDTAVTRQRWGAVTLGVGAALVAGGVTHWAFWVRGGEAGVAVAGRF
jgi:hypothetical protein